ncbi:MAG: glycine zipper 2TM domain-containing protein [Betaproteobacteria bacterium]|nr:glycine zipper 2TM domain-containing protein [Betaproteobacteria bacterium]
MAGGVVGGLLGHQIGGGRGKDLATVAGAVGGAVAGHQIEKSVRKTTRYEVTVRFEDGSTKVFSQDQQPTWRSGDRVKVTNGAIAAEF